MVKAMERGMRVIFMMGNWGNRRLQAGSTIELVDTRSGISNDLV